MSKRKNHSENKIRTSRLSDGDATILISQHRATGEPVKPLLEEVLSIQTDNNGAQIPSALKDTTIVYFREEAKLMNERIKWYLEQQEKIETQGLFASGA